MPAADFHGWVEFGNRIVTGLVSIAVVLAVGASVWRQPRRGDLVWWSAGLVAGVAFQVGLGAVTVLTHLSPPIVMSHFLASQVLVAAAVVLTHRAEAEPLPTKSRRVRLPTSIRRLAWLAATLTAAAAWTGTVVTGTGPHGGDEYVERLEFALPSVARIHGITVVVLAAVTLLLGVALRRLATRHNDTPEGTWQRGAARPAMARPQALRPDTQKPDTQQPVDTQLRLALARRVRIVIAVMATQAAIGYIQYFNELPALLVALHVVGATLLTIAMTRLVLTATATCVATVAGSDQPASSQPTSRPPVTGETVGIAGLGFAE